MKILLMEDDPVLGDIVTDYLQQYYTTDRAFDSEEALDLIDETSYDLFIFDINVPGKSGIELIKDLEASTIPHRPSSLPPMRIPIISGRALMSERMTTLKNLLSLKS